MGKLYRMPPGHTNVWLRFLPIIGIFVLTFLLAWPMRAQESVAALTLRQGSYGEEVKALQTELQRQGFFSGSIDGIYGESTIKAVAMMQRVTGLTPDGVAGPQTLSALGLAPDSPTEEAVAGAQESAGEKDAPSSDLSAEEITLLARAICAEAADAPYIGKVAVGAVLLNRVSHADFPNTLADVIYQPQALAAASAGRLNVRCSEEGLRAARDAAAGWDPTYGCLYFWQQEQSANSWLWTRRAAISYGNHVFGI